MFDKYSTEEKNYLYSLRANNYPVSSCLKKFKEEYPDSHIYARDAYYKFFKTEEAIDGIQREVEKIREEAKTHSYASRGSRIASLVEVAERLFNKLREFTEAQIASPDFKRVFEMWSQSFRQLREETEVLGLGDGTALDIFASFVEMVEKDKKVPSFVQRSLKSVEKEIEN